jgi:hypothetical protein
MLPRFWRFGSIAVEQGKRLLHRRQCCCIGGFVLPVGDKLLNANEHGAVIAAAALLLCQHLPKFDNSF